MVKVFMLGNLSEIEPKFTCQKCLRSESDLLVQGGGGAGGGCPVRLVGMGEL